MNNQSPKLVLIDNTPHELWFGKNPCVVDLRVFWCTTFVHVPKKKSKNMDN